MAMLQHSQCHISVPGNEPSLEQKSMDHYTGKYFQRSGLKSSDIIVQNYKFSAASQTCSVRGSCCVEQMADCSNYKFHSSLNY